MSPSVKILHLQIANCINVSLANLLMFIVLYKINLISIKNDYIWASFRLLFICLFVMQVKKNNNTHVGEIHVMWMQ